MYIYHRNKKNPISSGLKFFVFWDHWSDYNIENKTFKPVVKVSIDCWYILVHLENQAHELGFLFV